MGPSCYYCKFVMQYFVMQYHCVNLAILYAMCFVFGSDSVSGVLEALSGRTGARLGHGGVSSAGGTASTRIRGQMHLWESEPCYTGMSFTACSVSSDEFIVFRLLTLIKSFCVCFVQEKEKVPYTACGKCMRVSCGISTVLFWVILCFLFHTCN